MSAISSLDFTPQGLFPRTKNPENDPRCIVVAKVIKEIADNTDMNGVNQEMLQGDAIKKYRFILYPRNFHPTFHLELSDETFALHSQQGVSIKTAIDYYSFLIPKND